MFLEGGETISVADGGLGAILKIALHFPTPGRKKTFVNYAAARRPVKILPLFLAVRRKEGGGRE